MRSDVLRFRLMEDYSQNGEQAIILETLGIIMRPTGSFLDIGAYNPTCFSNTRALYELGWGGLMLEPSPACMLSLIEAYGNDPRITLVQAAVTADIPGLIKLHVTPDAVSTTSEVGYELWKDSAKFIGSVMVPALSVADLFNRFGGDFQFVNIDTEGTSVDVFIAMLNAGPRPRVVCCEHDGRVVEINQYAEAGNYRQVHLNQTNAIFCWNGPR